MPAYVHLRMGMSAVLAGLVISIQYIATFLSRPWAGRISDSAGAKVSVLWGMGACSASGGLVLLAAGLHRNPWLAFSALIVGPPVLGIGESLGSTGATLWGIASAGPEYTAKVISFNGISTFGALALGAPLGVVPGTVLRADRDWRAHDGDLRHQHGDGEPQESQSSWRRANICRFGTCWGAWLPMAWDWALGGRGVQRAGYVLTLFYASRHWNGAALCLTAFGIAFVAARILFIHAIDRFGGFPVGIVSLLVESAGCSCCGLRLRRGWTFAGAALTGFGNSLIFPALGVEGGGAGTDAQSRHGAGRLYRIADVSFFMVGPLAGAVIGSFGYASVFLFALVCVFMALGIVLILAARKAREAAAREASMPKPL